MLKLSCPAVRPFVRLWRCHLAVAGLVGSLFLPSAVWAAPASLELGPLRMTPPDGWVRNPSPQSLSWLPVADPSGNSCIIIMMEMAVLSDKPAEAFTELWTNSMRAYRGYRPMPPAPNVTALPGGFKLAAGAYAGPFNQKPHLYYAMANVTDGNAGLAFVSAGVDKDNCHASFAAFLKSLVVIAPSAWAGAAGSNGTYDSTGNIRQDAQRASQRAQASQTQDRLFQQRQFERQSQNRLVQQSLLDSQAQQRIQDSYRRR
jgi:hypothetical protein